LRFAKCEYDKCVKKDNCERFVKATADVVNYKNICGQWNNYRWYEPIEKEIIEKIEGEENIKKDEVEEDESKSE
jgi:hypothetical protein